MESRDSNFPRETLPSHYLCGDIESTREAISMRRPLPFGFVEARRCLCLWTLFQDVKIRWWPKCFKGKRLFNAGPFWKTAPILVAGLLLHY
jgi:hypothetical protein